MIALAPQEVTPAITSLFDLARPTMLRACAVLHGTTHGQILVDDPAQPTWAAVRIPTYGTLYLGGQISASMLATLVAHFRQVGAVGIGCWLDDPLNALLPPDPDYDGRTIAFPQRSLAVDVAALIAPLSDGYRLVVRDAHWLPKSLEYDALLNEFGTVAQILRHTRGMLLVHEAEVLCEASTSAPTHGQVEMGVFTRDSHRQRGFATRTCAALIAHCEAQGYATWWDCATQNTASARLARRLGYQHEREYRYVWWAQHTMKPTCSAALRTSNPK